MANSSPARRRRGDDGRQGGAVRYRPAPDPRGQARQGQPPPEAGLGRAGRGGGAHRRRGGDRRGARGRPRRGGRVRPRPPGRVGPCLGCRERHAAIADRRVAGQALAGDPRPDDRRRRGDQGAHRPAVRSLLLGREDGLAAGERRGRGGARDAGTLRIGTVDSYLCDRLGAGFATDEATASRTQLHTLGEPGFDPWLCERFGISPEVLPDVLDTAGDLGTMSHDSWPAELPLRSREPDQQAALAGRAA